MNQEASITNNILEANFNDYKRLRDEKKRMNKIMGALIVRQLFPSRMYRSTELEGKKFGKKFSVRYRIKSVFPNKNVMLIAYDSPVIMGDNQLNEGQIKKESEY